MELYLLKNMMGGGKERKYKSESASKQASRDIEKQARYMFRGEHGLEKANQVLKKKLEAETPSDTATSLLSIYIKNTITQIDKDIRVPLLTAA